MDVCVYSKMKHYHKEKKKPAMLYIGCYGICVQNCIYTYMCIYIENTVFEWVHICLCEIKVLVWTVCDSYLGKRHLFLSLKELFWHMSYGGKCCEIVYLFEPKKKDTKNILHNVLPGISHQTHSRELILQWSKWMTQCLFEMQNI